MSRTRKSATAAQTRAYAARADVLAPQLRAEIARVPAVAHGRAALVVLMGLPGVGKTHCARLLAERLGAAHVASDELRSRLFIAASYADEENRVVFATAAALVDGLLADGHRVVLDATNVTARNRASFVDAATRRGAPVVYARVTAPDADVRSRLALRRAARAVGDHSDADEGVFERMRAVAFEPPPEGHLEVENGPALERDLARVMAAVEAAG